MRIIGYVLVSDGPHPRGGLAHCERARPQIRTIKSHAKDLGMRPSIIYDYSRKVRTLSDLPVLAKMLARLDALGPKLLVVECLARLLQRPEYEDRASFASELARYDMHIYGALQKKRLSDLNQKEFAELLHRPPPKRPVAARRSKSPRNTAAATLASENAKRNRSRKDAAMLAEIRKEIADQGNRATLKAIADEANARGYRNQRGGPWTEQTVHIRLRHIDER